MNRKLQLLTVAFFICNISIAQSIYDGLPQDSVEITFDSLQISDVATDSAGLWQIGTTSKPFFIQGGLPLRSMMTDTIGSYPVNANSWFKIKFHNGYANTIVDFRHKYQTTSLHDGCIVEFSTDDGASWENVKGQCNGDSFGNYNAVLTSNFYMLTDTLFTGEMGFSGNSQGWIYSRIQFFFGFPIKSADSTSDCNISADTVHLRFRFVSDSLADTLDGWLIESIKIERDYYQNSIIEINKLSGLLIHPNPSRNGLLHFPELPDEKKYTTEIINSLGQCVLSQPYRRQLDLSAQPKGLYFYRVTNGSNCYSGKILLE
jgi:hypothetical protein